MPFLTCIGSTCNDVTSPRTEHCQTRNDATSPLTEQCRTQPCGTMCILLTPSWVHLVWVHSDHILVDRFHDGCFHHGLFTQGVGRRNKADKEDIEVQSFSSSFVCWRSTPWVSGINPAQMLQIRPVGKPSVVRTSTVKPACTHAVTQLAPCDAYQCISCRGVERV